MRLDNGPIRFVWSFLRAEYLRVILAVTLGLFNAGFILLSILGIGKFYELAFQRSSVRSEILDFLPAVWISSLESFLKFFAFILIVRFLLGSAERFVRGWIAERAVCEIRAQLFEKHLQTSYTAYAAKGMDRYLYRFSGDFTSVQNLISKGILGFVSDAVLVTASAICMALLLPSAAAYILGGLFLSGVAVVSLNRWLYGKSVGKRNARASVLSFVSRSLKGIKSIKVLNRKPIEIKRFQTRNRKAYVQGVAFHFVRSVILSFVSIVPLALVAVVFLVLESRSLVAEADPESVITLVLILIYLGGAFRRFFRVPTTWYMALISLRKLEDIFSQESEIEKKSVLALSQDISISFQGRTWVCKPAEIVDVVLDNHQSYYKLLNQLGGMEPPGNTAVYVDGITVDMENVWSLRKLVNFMTAEVPVIGGKAWQCVSYSSRSKSRAAEIMEYLQQDLPEKEVIHVEDKVLEPGGWISPSQRHMLLAARALLSSKPVMVIQWDGLQLNAGVRKRVSTLLEKKIQDQQICVFSIRSKENGMELLSAGQGLSGLSASAEI